MKLTQDNIKRVQNITGAVVLNSEGERLGFVAGTLSVSEITSRLKNPEYIVIGSDSLDTSSTKYFAIPAYTEFINMSNPDSTITAMFTRENLVRAKRISVDNCPEPFDHEPLIYELTDFAITQNENADC